MLHTRIRRRPAGETSGRPGRAVSLGALGLVVVLASGVTALSLDDTDRRGGPADGDRSYAPTGVLGDVDGDSRVSAEEKADLQNALDATRVVAKTMAPTKGVDTLLVTPAGTDWWVLVTSMSNQTGLWAAPPPPAADFYAYTEGRAYADTGTTMQSYAAIHVAFPTPAEATAWVERISADGTGSGAQHLIRDNVVTSTPIWVDPATEPYPKSGFDRLEDADVPVGYWRMDVGQRLDLLAGETQHPEAYRTAWKHLGFVSDSMSWEATSPTAEGPWAGRLAGFDPGRVDVLEAAITVNRTARSCLDPTPGCVPTAGLQEMLTGLYAVDAAGHYAGDTPWMPVDAPADAEVAIGMAPYLRGLANMTREMSYPPVTLTQWWVDPAGETLTIKHTYADAPSA